MYRQAGSQNAEGGFFNDNSMYSPNVNNDRKKDVVRKQQTVASASIKQLLNCEGDSLMIGSHEITLVKIMAKVISINVTNVKTEYVLEDETGTILGVAWRDGDANEENAEAAPVVENSFCQVVGSLRSVEDSKNLLVLHISAVNDPNMLTEHLLSIVHTSLKARISTAVATGSQDTKVAAVSSVAGAGSSSNSTGSPEEMIHKFITESGADVESGVDKRLVINEFGNKFSTKKIDEVLSYLCAEGQIYTTINDDFFKSTD